MPRLQLFYFTFKFEIECLFGATALRTRTEMMALKALISRKWKLDNCSAERDRRARARWARWGDSCFGKCAETKPKVKFDILCKRWCGWTAKAQNILKI